MTAPARLVVSSLLAENADPLFADVAEYLAHALDLDVGFARGGWESRRRMLATGGAHLAGLCGALYLFDAELRTRLEPLVAPIASGEAAPVYFTEVVTRRAHEARRFGDLRGCAWAYNEPASHSGYHVVRAHLATLGERGPFFGRVREAGSHQAALELVVGGEADAAPIDSYVLACELARRPELKAALRVVARLGPSPAPPIAVSSALPAPFRERALTALTSMQEDSSGRRLLERHLLERFVPVSEADYEPIRRMAAAGEGVALASADSLTPAPG